MFMDPRYILFALQEMKEIGWITILKIIRCYADLKELVCKTSGSRTIRNKSCASQNDL
jgi:hypothetical protein